MKKYSIIAALNIEKLEINEPINEEQIILEHVVFAINAINAHLKFQSFYEGWSRIWNQKFPLEAFEISINEMSFFEKETEHDKTVRQMKSKQLKKLKKYNEKCYQLMYESAVAEALINIPADLKKRLKSLTRWQLKECYDRAHANSFIIIREQAFGDLSLFNNRLLVDIGDAFHNYRDPNNLMFNIDVISDLMAYECWLNTINILANQHYIDYPHIPVEAFSLRKIMKVLLEKNVHFIKNGSI